MLQFPANTNITNMFPKYTKGNGGHKSLFFQFFLKVHYVNILHVMTRRKNKILRLPTSNPLDEQQYFFEILCVNA